MAILAKGSRTIYDTTDDMTLDQAKAAARAELGDEIDGLETRVSAAELKITPTAITATVRESTEYVADLGALEDATRLVAGNVTALATRVSTAESKITPTAITSTVRSSTEYVADQGALQDGIDGVAEDIATETTNRESAITQLSDLIDLRVIKGDLETYLRLIEAGVQIGKSNSPYNVLIDDDSVDIVQSGVTIATFAFNKLWTKAAEVDNYVKIGGATMEWSDTTGFSLDV